MNKKKILILSMAYYPRHIGGAEVAIKEITGRMSTEEYEFHLICNRYDSTLPKEEVIGNVHVHRIGIVTKSPTMTDLRKLPLHLNKLFFQWSAYHVAKRLHARENFSLIWAMMAHATGVPAARFKEKFNNVPFVLTLQEGDPPDLIEKTMRPFEPYFMRAFTSADAIQVISNFLGSWATRKGSKHTPILIPNAVDTKHFSNPISDRDTASVRQELGLSDTAVALVTTSRLVKKNGLDTVIEALPLLPKEVVFVIFGVGPEEECLKSLAAKHNVTDRVFFKGQISHDVMPKYLKACNIFIRPSRSEGMGNSFVEAMAAELPVIATPVGGIVDFLIEGETGWFATVDNPDSIVAAYDRIHSNIEETAKVLKNAKTMAVERYNWDLIAKRMENEVFRPLLNETR